MNTQHDKNGDIGDKGRRPAAPDTARESGNGQQQEKNGERKSDGIEKDLDTPAEESIHGFERYQ